MAQDTGDTKPETVVMEGRTDDTAADGGASAGFQAHAVKGVQQMGTDCVICGDSNDLSMHAQFLDLQDGSIYAIFHPGPQHQSYPGRIHGGMLTAMIDETIGRAIMNIEPGTWGVTAEMNIKFRKPVPYDHEIHAVGRVTKNHAHFFKGSAEILADDGSVAVEGTGTYVKLSIDTIAPDATADEVLKPDPRPWPPTVEF